MRYLWAIVLLVLLIAPASAIVDNLTGTQSVMNFNGTTGSTTMLDGNRTIVWNAVGSAQLNQSNYKWGGSSLRLFGAANKGNVSVQGNDFASVGAGDYTMEFWFNMTAHEPTIDMFVSQDSGTGFAFYYEVAGQYYQLYQNGNLTTIGKTPATTGVWHHLALVRQGGYEHVYLDGTSITSLTVSAISPITPNSFSIGSWGNGASYFYNGFIDDFRFSNYAVYTSDFTPPTEEFVYNGPPSAIPDFSGNITQSSQYGMPVMFTNTTTFPQTIAWNWSFGDGNTSTVRQPVKIFSVAGLYNVTLNATNSTGITTVTKNGYINLTSDSDAYLKSWQHMNGVTGGASFPDLQGNAWSVNSVTTDTTRFKYGNGSALFNAAGDSLRTSSGIIDLGPSPFTLEGWAYPTASGSNYFLLSRTSSSTTKSDGWGIYHSTASAASDGWVFWMGNAAANSTGTFSLPINTWSHYAVQRYPNSTVIVFVNGIPVASKTGLNGPFDTVNPTTYGNPPVGTGSSFLGNLDETRISVGIVRWDTTFTPPFAEYRGTLYDTTPDINPDSTLRYKTSPPASAPIANLTPRNRTAQIQYVLNATNISMVMSYNPQHYRVVKVLQNSTMWSGINYTTVIDNPVAGTLLVNATRPGGFSTTGFTDSRGSFVDIQMNYWNYTPDTDDDAVANYQYFSSGFLKNGTTQIEYPVHNFIPTNVTPLTWITYSNFTVNNNTAVVGVTPVTFFPMLNMSASRYLWDFGDGTTFLSGNGSVTHIFSTTGLKTVSLTAYLWQNTSVTNTTTLHSVVNVTYPDNYVSADFVGMPTSGSPSLLVSFTDLSTRWNVSSQTCNWSFGDSLSTSPYSSTCGNVQHVYAYGGIYTVNYSITTSSGTSYMLKTDYISVSSGQNSNIIWSPSSVAIQVLDANRNPIVGAPVHLNAYSTSLPGGLSGAIDYFKNTYGVTTSTAQSMFNSSTTYDGITDDYGFVATQVVEVIQYQITTQDVNGISEVRYMWPTGPYFQIVTGNATVSGIAAQGRTQNAIYQNSTFNTTFWEPNTTYSCMGINVYDSTGHTTNVSAWWKLVDNATMWWTNSTFIGGYGPINSTKCVPHVPYQQWKWGGITD